MAGHARPHRRAWRDCCRGTVASFFEGEVEPCINGGVLALGAYFGEASDRLVDRLLGEQLEDGGWNCEAPKSRRSSFHTTICVLEGLLEYEKAKGVTAAVTEARIRGQEYLLERRMFRRLSTGEVVETTRQHDGRWLLHYPDPDPPRRWSYPINFDMEGGEDNASRWNTLRALRVLDWYSGPTILT